MGRWATYPDEIEDLKTLSVTDLKKLNLLHQYFKSGKRSIQWTRNGENDGSISVTVQTGEKEGIIFFDYTYNKTEEFKYSVQLTSRPSNIGNGLIWFFVCPKTQKVCRKLTLYAGHFLHRTAFKINYRQQNESKKMRLWSIQFGDMLDETIYSQLHKKHLKKHYRGKPTKRYSRIMQKIRRIESISIEDYERSLLM